MAVEKTVQDRHEYARLQIEGLMLINPPRSPAEYRARDPSFKDPEVMPALHCGQKIVLRCTKHGEVQGYVLGRVLDWEEREGWWELDTTVYFVAEEASHEKVDQYLGRIRWARFAPPNYRSLWHAIEIVSFDPADMPRRPGAA